LDPAEELVELWLNSNGFFTRNGVMVGHRGLEIDFLAVDATGDKRVHIESTVSVKPFGPLRPWGAVEYSKLSFEDRVRLYYQKKFVGLVSEKTRELENKAIEKKVNEIFGGKTYQKWLILGRQEEGNEKIRSAFKEHGVVVHFMDEVLNGIKFVGTPRNDTARFLQISALYLTEDSRSGLLATSASYKRGKSCGRGRHDYMDMGTYFLCTKCGSSKTKSR
jgi:hypothetical protein